MAEPPKEILDPIVAMNAAVISVGNGECGEIEFTWYVEHPDGSEVRLTVTVRKDVQQVHFHNKDD